GREARAEPFLVRGEALHDVRGVQRVGVAERTAPEGRPAEAEHGADVAVARGAEDLLAQALRRLVDHLQDAALGDLLARGRAALLPSREQVVDAAVDFLVPLLLAFDVQIEALLRLAAQAAVEDHPLESFRRPHPLAE